MFIWCLYDVYMIVIWCLHDLYMIFILCLYDFTWLSYDVVYEFYMMFTWFLHDCCMIFYMNSICFDCSLPVFSSITDMFLLFRLFLVRVFSFLGRLLRDLAKLARSVNICRASQEAWHTSVFGSLFGCYSAPFNDLIDRGTRGKIRKNSTIYSKIMCSEVLGVLVTL